ncbi:MAG: DUF2461 domain-containing protein [Alistipes sp.]|nr:DUF2461 domain-containing protein [Alistipes sp.]MBO7282650.1 DUF2461 domain-containing protein [Alistipes sp.]
MDLILPFLRDIHNNDNNKWYLANSQRYVEAFDRNAKYIEKLIRLIGEFDPSISRLKLYQCSFSLMRDQRIKLDDREFNDFFSGSFTRGGKHSGYASYYYQISPEPSSSGGSFLAVGIYRPNKELMDYIRREITKMPEEFDQMVKSTGFELYLKDALLRVPGGFNADPRFEPYIFMRHMLLIRRVDISWFEQEDWCERTAEVFKECKPFIDFLNRTIDLYREESPLPVGHALRPLRRLKRETMLSNADSIMDQRKESKAQFTDNLSEIDNNIED